MNKNKLYALPELAYPYNSLEPFISEELLRLHHDKHHAAYVNGANAILEKMDQSNIEKTDFDAKAAFKELSFHIGGHFLHSLFWKNLSSASKHEDVGSSMTVKKSIEKEYGSLERFKKLFSQAASSTEGSGWAALSICKETDRPIIMQIEKHNINVYPTFDIIMVLDVWEHAYYLDYKNDRGKFIEAFWNIVNWAEVNKRLEKIMSNK
ncbi:MAG: superoxide dismutase [Candidatus Humimicrobiaceae bacterium]